MELRSLTNADCAHKQVLMRVDFNVDLEMLASPVESFRLTAVKESVEAILAAPGSTLTLITHFGRPEGKNDPKYSVSPLVPILEKILGQTISFTPDCLTTDNFSECRIALRENLRFYPEEEANDQAFAEKLAKGFDLFVNEAFSVSHRSHASVSAILNFLPSVAGIHLQKEVTALSRALEAPERPAVAILGGAKIETKLHLIHTFEKTYDAVLLGGRIANEAIDQHRSFLPNVFLPTDFRNKERFDIGDTTVEQYVEHIQSAKTIIWNGPLGKFEEAPYDTGTTKIVEALATSQAFVIAGGGESLAAIQKAGVFSQIDLVSTGGGAMLAFLAGESMPALEALS